MSSNQRAAALIGGKHICNELAKCAGASTSLGVDYASILLPMEAFPTLVWASMEVAPAREVVHSQEGEILRPRGWWCHLSRTGKWHLQWSVF